MKSLLQLLAVSVAFLCCSHQANAQLFPTFVRGNFTLGNDSSASSPYSLDDTFFLETNPGASKTIYLDYDGHRSFGNQWNHDITFDSFDRNGNVDVFSNSELLEIQRQFQNVAEDFAPFDVNVTTLDPGLDRLIRADSADQVFGVRVLNTQNEPGSGAGGGGTAYLNSFGTGDNREAIAFTFNKGANVGGMTNSHEIGHTLGLFHDGLNGSTYHPGVNGNGPTSWGPLMGAPFSANVTQWSNGDYENSTSTQDDLAVITRNRNGINFKADTVGDSTGDAYQLEADTAGEIFDFAFIEQSTDVDVFAFETAAGQVAFDIDPFQGRANLDVLASLLDSDGNVLATNNPLNSLSASFDLILDAGQYFLSVEGTGLEGVYSDYGSLGFYTVSGSIQISAIPEPASLSLIVLIGIGFVSRRHRN